MVFWRYHGTKNPYCVNPSRFTELKVEHADRERKRLQSSPELRKRKSSYLRNKYLTNETFRTRIKARAKKQRTQPGYREKYRQYLSKWGKLNPAKCRMWCVAKRARKKSQVPAGANKKIISTIYETRVRVTKCTGVQFHVDHIVPLARGGPHTHTNLQLLPAKINISKGAKMPLDKIHTMGMVCIASPSANAVGKVA